MKELKNEKSDVLLHIALIRLNEEIRVAGIGVHRIPIRGITGYLSGGLQDAYPGDRRTPIRESAG